MGQPIREATASQAGVFHGSTGLPIWAYGETREELIQLLPYYQELADARAFVVSASEAFEPLNVAA